MTTDVNQKSLWCDRMMCHFNFAILIQYFTAVLSTTERKPTYNALG